ncbi:MAG: heparinase II/III-family protein, partial [Clostridia bacterium]|nr:heparinase II/III-family protein [Clostridia bacterium]
PEVRLLYALPAEDSIAPAEEDASPVLYTATNFAALRKPFLAILKSGVLNTSHRHLDNLSLILPPYADDLGTPGYAHPMTGSWYRCAHSHNTVLIDGGQPGAVLPSHVEAAGDGIRAVMDAPMTEGLNTAMRTLTPEGDTVLDEMLLEADSMHTYDWLFHCTGEFSMNAGSHKDDSLSDKPCFAHYEDVRRVTAADSLVCTFAQPDGRTVVVTVPEAENYEIFTALTPDNPADRRRHTLLLRVRGTTAKFVVKYEMR